MVDGGWARRDSPTQSRFRVLLFAPAELKWQASYSECYQDATEQHIVSKAATSGKPSILTSRKHVIDIYAVGQGCEDCSQ